MSAPGPAAGESDRPRRGLWPILRPDLVPCLALALMITAAAVLAVVPALITKAILDQALPQGRPDLVLRYGLLALLAVTATAALRYGQQWLSTLIGQRQLSRIRLWMFAKLHTLRWAYFERTPAGATVSRLTTEPAEAQNMASGVLPQLLATLASFAAVAVAMATISWPVTVAAAVLAPAILLPASLIGRRLRALNAGRLHQMGEIIELISQRASAPGALVARLYSRPEVELAGFRRADQHNRRIGMSVFHIGALYSGATALLGAAAGVLVYVLGGLRVIEGQVSTGAVVALAALVAQLYAPIDALGSIRVQMVSARASWDRIDDFLALPDEPAGDRVLPDRSGRGLAITFDGVGVRGPAASDGERVRQLDLEIAAGQHVALVGPSGAGKSTLLGLVIGLHRATVGQVRLDSTPVETLDRPSLRARVGLLAQTSHFFSRSVGEELRRCRPEAGDAELEDACRRAGIWDVITRLPDGLATPLGDHGSRLSGGEQQRLALARLLLLDPQVVLLDEPTAHLDEENAVRFVGQLHHLLAGRTVVLVTHDLQLAESFPRVVVMEAGRVAADGSPRELRDQAGWYRQTAPAVEAVPARRTTAAMAV